METTKTNAEKKVKYDLLFVMSPVLPEEKALEQVEHIRKLIESRNGTIFESDLPKLRPLAYAVTKTWEGKKSSYDQGLFGWMKLEVASEAVAAIQTELRTMSHLLRSALTYAYLDVRPVRRIPGTEDKPAEAVLPSAEMPMMPTTVKVQEPVVKKESVVSSAPAKVMNEAEIDKQIESLLS